MWLFGKLVGPRGSRRVCAGSAATFRGWQRSSGDTGKCCGNGLLARISDGVVAVLREKNL